MGKGKARRALYWLAVVCLVSAASTCLVIWWPVMTRLFAELQANAEYWRRDQPIAVAVGGTLMICGWIIILVPSTPIELTIAYMYGVGWGLAIIYTGKVLGCLLSFLLGRTLFRDCCKKYLGQVRLLVAIERAVSKEPLRISMLARGAYIPIAVKNYGFALLSVPLRPFTISLITVELYNSLEICVIGAAARSIRAASDVRGVTSGPAAAMRTTMLCIAGVLLVVFGLYGAVVTQRALSEIEAEQEVAHDPEAARDPCGQARDPGVLRRSSPAGVDREQREQMYGSVQQGDGHGETV